MMDLEEAILGYLDVLAVPEVMDRLDGREIALSHKSLMGSLVALEEILEAKRDFKSVHLLATLREREYRNATEMRPRGDPMLEEVTKRLAWELLRYLSESC